MTRFIAYLPKLQGNICHFFRLYNGNLGIPVEHIQFRYKCRG